MALRTKPPKKTSQVSAHADEETFIAFSSLTTIPSVIVVMCSLAVRN